MTGLWISAPGSRVRHLGYIGGPVAERVGDRLYWNPACRTDLPTTSLDESLVVGDDTELRPCRRCIRVLRWRVGYLQTILAEAVSS